MSAIDLQSYVSANPLFAGLTPDNLHQVFDGAQEEYFANDRFIFRQGGEAAHFYLIREGKVSLEVSAPGKPSITLQTLGPGDVLGWSWLMPPYTWNFDAKALDVTLAVAIDGKKLLGLIAADDRLGKLLSQRFLAIMMQRLQATRMQLLDVYGRAE